MTWNIQLSTIAENYANHFLVVFIKIHLIHIITMKSFFLILSTAEDFCE